MSQYFHQRKGIGFGIRHSGRRRVPQIVKAEVLDSNRRDRPRKLRLMLSSRPPVFGLGKTYSLLRFKPLKTSLTVAFTGTSRFLPDLLSLI